ncbi:MAG TPA: STAS domain-containing protein, partial [Acidimicrobiales bacterium]|nr:STAS domain-containing protein [Acidimicrobiales bacterium]
VRLRGELDLAAVPALWSCLAPVAEAGIDPRQHLVLDLSDLAFMDAAGFGVLIRLANRLRSTGVSMSIRSPQPLVRRVMDLADVGHVLQVEPEPG